MSVPDFSAFHPIVVKTLRTANVNLLMALQEKAEDKDSSSGNHECFYNGSAQNLFPQRSENIDFLVALVESTGIRRGSQ